ncbi:MAG: hypothetical protein KI791_11825 [Cyclobacteriaceae bacterium]|nr:hypothetical protein [Cyclobacteriaceae bacterium SS2]
MKIQPNEYRITGKWEFVNGEMIGDRNCKRIEFLTSEILEEVASDESGWYTLFFNTELGNYWELSYPQSELHGGGPPELSRNDDLDQLQARYNFQLHG